MGNSRDGRCDFHPARRSGASPSWAQRAQESNQRGPWGNLWLPRKTGGGKENATAGRQQQITPNAGKAGAMAPAFAMFVIILWYHLASQILTKFWYLRSDEWT